MDPIMTIFYFDQKTPIGYNPSSTNIYHPSSVKKKSKNIRRQKYIPTPEELMFLGPIRKAGCYPNFK